MAAVLNPGITPIWHLSVDKYHAMIDKGILSPDDAVELLDGVIVQKMSKNPPHSFATRATRIALERIAPAGWFVDNKEPITLSGSEPEPDVAVIRGEPRDYIKRHPGPAEVGLVVEVADATLERDKILKAPIYAAAGIPWYWVLDLNGGRLEVYSEPGKAGYMRHTTRQFHDSATVTLDGIAVGDVVISRLLP